MKFKTVRILFSSEFSVCCHPKNLLPWQREVTTSPLYCANHARVSLPNLPTMLEVQTFSGYYPYIKLFHSRDQQLCKFIRTKEIVYIRKEFNSTGLVWDTNMAAISLFWNTNMATVTSCENAL